MREVEIKLTGAQVSNGVVVSVDDSELKVKKNEFGNYVGKFTTGNDNVNIKIFRMLDVGGLLWFLTQIFFFLISIFGIFDVHHKEKCLVIDFDVVVGLQDENKIELQLNVPQENMPAVSVRTGLITQTSTNEYYLDKKAKRTLKILNFTKLFLTLAIIAISIAVIMIKI